MHYEVDQSGKIEQTHLDTIIGMTSESIEYSIKLPKSLKKQLQNTFRELKKIRSFSYIIFASLIATLLAVSKPQKRVIIDNEYQGHEEYIRSIINHLLKSFHRKTIHFEFGYIGKSSRADQYCKEIVKKLS
jgi:single-stranded DNA-specific DHH superfamily exonuclease